MSMISELVKELREASDWHYHNTDQDLGTLLDKSADTIEMLSEKARADRPTWIPCSERLPELHREDPAVNIEPQLNLMADYYMMSDPVLVMRNGPFTDKNKRIMVAQYEDDLDGRVYWLTLDLESLPDVIAWQPLPAPYGGESDG